MTDNILAFPPRPDYPRRRGGVKFEALIGSHGPVDWADVDRKTRKFNNVSWPGSAMAAEIYQDLREKIVSDF